MTIPVIYENGVFRPEVPVDLPSGTRGDLEVRRPPAELSDEELLAAMKLRYPHSLGIASHEEAEELRQIVEAEFEQVNPDDWR